MNTPLTVAVIPGNAPLIAVHESDALAPASSPPSSATQPKPTDSPAQTDTHPRSATPSTPTAAPLSPAAQRQRSPGELLPRAVSWSAVAEVAPVGEGVVVAIYPDDAPAPAGCRWAPARAALAQLTAPDQASASRAIAVANWRLRGGFCPACGGLVAPEWNPGGWRCRREGTPVFPRTDPCVITAVLDGSDRLLLSHASNHPEGMYTLVAGFVEAGESLEDAVQRETLEEVGVPIAAMRFIRSQPWPFPGSLMASFVALAADTRIIVDGAEITDARWFTPPELAAAEQAGELALPMPYSVARQTIEAWRTGELTWHSTPPPHPDPTHRANS